MGTIVSVIVRDKLSGLDVQDPKYAPALGPGEVSYIPLTVACDLSGPYNMISIASDESERPEFDDRSRVLKLSGTEVLTLKNAAKIEQFVDACKGGPIYVHCYYGEVRSRSIASYIAGKFNYHIKSRFGYIDQNGGYATSRSHLRY